MDQILASIEAPIPVRVSATDDPAELLRFAIDAHGRGAVALATLVEIRGGAARTLGSHVVVAADGRFCGYVSGGCVEAAVASEAFLAMTQGRDRTVKFGDGSPFFDIVLPCGGGISIAIHVLKNVGALQDVLERLGQRRTAGLAYSPERQTLEPVEPPPRARWLERDFVGVYRPRTRVVLSGQTIEAQAVARLAEASGYDVIIRRPGEEGRAAAGVIDRFTAVVLLHHDLDAEAAILQAALRSPAFYIGALGSTRTHRRRVERLTALAFGRDEIDRIKAPIGMFGPTRDATSLALSVLADIAAARLVAYA
ncbi:xanthine and CO dehydrogenases maturation factor, XdhC/CoxF family [Rhizobium leguminosarum bv. trifolii WSM2297]|uniref:Xanthine and CO dehydrogenases maturation factor, XdhC/CoxF family n=1 Tax=Rhizobium leguminosarum bv. trifolii WSM2297 TaxID=754762 RepID=J0KZU2_RHILT|nr:XdhC family protein [Rhizobium leguminosarum]EJC83364.1 xanthine and CO dehydrogenases maturation factor, XdhC/CoxF family [Rhizobium leguminosarum bv. trifolii WSM2297]EJC85042.1 xanthine and CO dehydrogenases maturation factor, XdhC/CoxF family [Rhizobium leguminosarum bv. trifolii WSM2297]